MQKKAMYQLAGFFRVEPSSMLLSLFISDTTFKMTVIVVSSLWLFVVESRDAATLVPILKKWILPGKNNESFNSLATKCNYF